MNINEAKKLGLRPCVVRIVKEKYKAYFHQWENFSRPLAASLLKGGAPAGIFVQTFGIVEDAETGQIFKCVPSDIRFVDEFVNQSDGLSADQIVVDEFTDEIKG